MIPKAGPAKIAAARNKHGTIGITIQQNKQFDKRLLATNAEIEVFTGNRIFVSLTETKNILEEIINELKTSANITSK